MKRLCWISLAIAGCVSKPGVDPAFPRRWVPVERMGGNLAYPAGDGAVDSSARIIVLVPSPPAARGRRAAARLSIPGQVRIGEAFRIEVRVPRGEEDETRVFRVHCGRAGLRFPDGDRAVVMGRASTFLRAVAESAGPASFELVEIDN